MKKQLPKKKAKSEINSVILDGPPPIQRIIKDITNKVSVKLYGDKELSKVVVDLLAEHGSSIYGFVNQGHPYTNRKGDRGFASSVTAFKTIKH